MQSEPSLDQAERLVRRLFVVGVFLLCVQGAAAVYVLAAPVASGPQVAQARRNGGLAPLPLVQGDLTPLVNKLSGRRLIQTAQVQAAVKDDGASQRLLSTLRLQGIVQSGGALTAYVMVPNQGLRTVREGQSLLDFTVEKVNSGSVVLSLRGVQTELTYSIAPAPASAPPGVPSAPPAYGPPGANASGGVPAPPGWFGPQTSPQPTPPMPAPNRQPPAGAPPAPGSGGGVPVR